MITLTAERKRFNAYHIETRFFNEAGKEVHKNLTMLNQLRKGTKETTIKGTKYLLVWK